MFIQVVAAVFVALTLFWVFKRVIARFTNPIVSAAIKQSHEIKKLRRLAAELENELLPIADEYIRQIGEAMLIDGEDTVKINSFMLDLLEESRKAEAVKSRLVHKYEMEALLLKRLRG